jgi:hypothetical protein
MTLANVTYTQMNTINIPFNIADLLKSTVQDYILSDCFNLMRPFST